MQAWDEAGSTAAYKAVKSDDGESIKLSVVLPFAFTDTHTDLHGPPTQ
jgi:hypothetical protein